MKADVTEWKKLHAPSHLAVTDKSRNLNGFIDRPVPAIVYPMAPPPVPVEKRQRLMTYVLGRRDLSMVPYTFGHDEKTRPH